MMRKLLLTSLLLAATAAAAISPADARGWTYTGPHGATVTHWGGGRYWGPCCGGRVAAGAVAGLAAGTAIGIAAGSRPRVVYAPPPVVYRPPVVYAPRGYYYVP